MKLFRTINSKFDPNQPVIEWDGDVRGIIAARRARDAVDRRRRSPLQSVWCLEVRPTVQSKLLTPKEVAA